MELNLHANATTTPKTRAYIQQFAAAYQIAKDAEDLIAIMTEKFPYHGNLWTLWFSAINAFELRNTESSAAELVR